MNIIIFGNSGSGKSTLAKRLSAGNNIPHLDLDEVAWQDTSPPERLPIAESEQKIDSFTSSNKSWVIEGCYTSLISHIAESASHLYFLNIPVEQCVENCQRRPWEPHKYKTKQQQDDNLPALIHWVKDYQHRDDEFSHNSHQQFFEKHYGPKTEMTSNTQAVLIPNTIQAK